MPQARILLILPLLLLVSIDFLPIGQAEGSTDEFKNGHQARSQRLSPTPDEYSHLHETACGVNGTQWLSKQQLIERYSSSDNERLKEVVGTYKIDQECRREPTAWRFRYIDESGDVLVRERSIDERSANVMYFVRAVKALSVDMFSYDWDDPALDEMNMNRVTGPKFDDDLCGKQLNQMQAIADDLSWRTSLLRANSSLNDPASYQLTDQHISLAKILDSYGRYESGRLFGKIFSAGSYFQCRLNRVILDRNETIKMRFCWAHMNYEAHLAESLRNRRRTKYEHPVNVLYTGICLPESCHSKSFARHREAIQRLVNKQFKMPISIYVDEHMNMSSLYCEVDENSEFGIPLMGKCLLGFVACWTSIAIVVTIWNTIRQNRKRPEWIAQQVSRTLTRTSKKTKPTLLFSFDLHQSWKDFLGSYRNPIRSRSVQLDTLNFFKVFGCAFVVIGHTMAVYGGYAMDDVRLARFMETDAVLCLILAGTLVVDSFFVITGILWAFFTLKRLDRKQLMKLSNDGHLRANLATLEQNINVGNYASSAKVDEGKSLKSGSTTEVVVIEACPQEQQQTNQTDVQLSESWPTTIKEFCLNWISFTGFRYLRIVPLYVLVHWFKKYVFIFAGSGPYWDHGFNYKTMSGACHKETPLTPFTFLAAYYPISRQCTLQSWSIANDLFFAIIAPPVILLISRRPRLALFLSLISCAISYYFAWDRIASLSTDVDEQLRELRSVGFYRFFDEVSILYTAPHYRVFNFLAGVWGGYVLYYKQVKINKLLKRCEQQQVNSTSELNNQNANNNDETDRVQVGLANSNSIQSNPVDKIEWPGWFRGIGTLISFWYMLSIFLAFGFNETFKVNSFGLHRLIYPQFLTTMRVGWALANVLIFLRMMTDWKDSLLMRWSASNFWLIFSKLNYGILLVHLDLLMYTMNVAVSLPTSFTRWTFFNMGSGIFMLCIPISFLIFIIYENPFDKLIRTRIPGY